MADYYPLLAKAVAGLPNASPDARHAIYERARKALISQLRAHQPPVPEANIAAENAALDQAIAKLEAELAGIKPPGESKEGAVAEKEKPPEKEKPKEQQAAPASAAAPERRIADSTADSPATVSPASPPLRTRARTAETPPVSNGATAQAAATPAASSTVQAASAPQTNPPGLKRRAAPAEEAVPAPTPSPVANTEETPADFSRPFAPQPKIERRAPKQLWIVGAAVTLVVVLVAIAAWKLRDRPEEFAQTQEENAPAKSDGNGKIIDRIGGGTITSSADEAANGAQGTGETAAASGSPAAGTAQQSGEQAASQAGSTANSASGQATGQTTGQASGSAIAQTGRAAFLMEAPDEANKVKTWTGTVTWRREMVANEANDPLDVAVRADIDIPAIKFQATLLFQKNTDLSLPATHTIKLNFNVAPDGPFANIKQISVPQLRFEDTPNGEALGGIPVQITDNAFLIGLSRGNSEATNTSLLKGRPWIDVPMMLGNGRIAKLTFEKGAAGKQALDEAFAVWSQGQMQ